MFSRNARNVPKFAKIGDIIAPIRRGFEWGKVFVGERKCQKWFVVSETSQI